MAAARQKEMKVSITELATTIRTLLGEPGGIACEPADISQDSSQRSFARSCLPNDEFTLGSRERQRKPRRRLLNSTRAPNPLASLAARNRFGHCSSFDLPFSVTLRSCLGGTRTAAGRDSAQWFHQR